jgi:prepilin-type N-terminal cleavage/methylation domain-containing protein
MPNKLARKTHRMKVFKQKGFTLIELMVVIGIIVLLATMMMVNYQGASKKARDSRRAADLEQLRSALEIEYTDANKYPASYGAWSNRLSTQGPKQNNTDDYIYTPLKVNGSTENNAYRICVELWEGDPANIPAANKPAATGCALNQLYGVTNP